VFRVLSMDRETKSVGLILVILALVGWGFVPYLAHIGFVAHSLGRSTSTETVVIAVLLSVFFVILSAFGTWIAYLIFFRFLNDIELTGDGYALRTGAPQALVARELRAVRKVGYTEGSAALTVVRADGKYWVCFSSKLAVLNASRNGGSAATNPQS
jgi:hypothetical protein